MTKLWYNCTDNGDGSVSVHFYKSKKNAKDNEIEEGFAESTVGYIGLKIINNKIHYVTHEFIEGKYKEIWHKINQI